MVNKLLQEITAGAAVLTLGTGAAVRAGELPKEFQPSPMNPNPVTVVHANNRAVSLPPSSPTNPNPPPDQARSLAMPVFIAEVSSQIAQTNEPRTAPLPPENYGKDGAKAIAELEMQIRQRNQMIQQDNENSVNQMQQNGDKFKQFLRNRQQSQ